MVTVGGGSRNRTGQVVIGEKWSRWRLLCPYPWRYPDGPRLIHSGRATIGHTATKLDPSTLKGSRCSASGQARKKRPRKNRGLRAVCSESRQTFDPPRWTSDTSAHSGDDRAMNADDDRDLERMLAP
jgi:hypothetical protein